MHFLLLVIFSKKRANFVILFDKRKKERGRKIEIER